MDNSPCEYCGAALPFGVDKPTRRVRSHHFQNCSMRPQREEVEQPRREWRGLSDDDIAALYVKWDDTPGVSMADFARAVEQALRSKNNG